MSRFRNLLIGAACALALASPVLAQQKTAPEKTGLGRTALPEEVAAWDIDVRPDGQGLPAGKGSVKQGEELYIERCASCHGDFGQGEGRWPVLAGGQGSMKSERPEKTIGSFWPFTSTVFDYIYRAMPYGNARSLTADETYAITAFLLNLNNLVPDDFVLSKENFLKVRLPNEPTFYDDDREQTEKHFWNRTPCMTQCKTEVKVLNRARIVDVTPEEAGRNVRVE